MSDILPGDQVFMRSLPQTVFGLAGDHWTRQYRQQIARLQRGGLISVKLDEALGAGRPAMAVVALTDKGRAAAGFSGPAKVV